MILNENKNFYYLIMCGIAGYIGKFPPGPDNLNQTSKILNHRGPDGKGFYNHKHHENNITLIHRRLSIIDLDERSNQPFLYNSTVLIFNGEIYNYLEVRKNLEGLGHNFKTKGDTEVLSHALCQWGSNALDKLEGMWAFAWYNEKDGSLILSRDRFAEKPLYFWKKNKGIYFSSEIKGLAALSGEWPQINENHLLRNLVNGYKSIYKTSETFFKQVKELPSGTYLKVDSSNNISSHKYWNFSNTEKKNLLYPEAVEMTKDAVVRAVRLRMRSDVPIAFCMSGGVDSNTLISVASKILNRDVHGFTIINKDKRYEEQTIVNKAIKELDIKHTPIELDQKNFLENLSTLIKIHDAPVYTISYYVQWQLMKAVADHGYKVSISGTGADELFTGYYDHHNLYLYEVFKDKNLYNKSLNFWQKYQSNLVRNPFLKNPNLYIENKDFRNHIFFNNDLFSSWLKEKWSESFKELNYVSGLLRNRMLNEMFVEAVPVILHEDDLNAMSFSIENRSPFLDRNLFEIAYSIPTSYLIKNGRAKAVLRDAMRTIVPNFILDERRKVGFNAPITDLLNIDDPKIREYLLDDSIIFNLVKKDKIEILLKSKDIPNSISKFLFNFLNMKIFMENLNK